jgi:hypothetical protein
MKITFKGYKRRDDSWMIYLNNDRKVSLGVSTEKGFGPSTKRTKGEEKLIQAASRAFFDNALPFTGSIEDHDEVKAVCGPYTLLGTDVATIGGMKVPSDGGYIVRDGRYLPCGQWFSVED